MRNLLDQLNGEERLAMNIGPTPEMREACRRILGCNDPATVLGAIRNGDPRWEDVEGLHADILEQKRTGKPSLIHGTHLRMLRLKAGAETTPMPHRPRQGNWIFRTVPVGLTPS